MSKLPEPLVPFDCKSRKRSFDFVMGLNYAHIAKLKSQEAKSHQKALIRATPKNISSKDRLVIKSIYKSAKKLTIETGIKYHVDHIIPLRGKYVCGLNVPWNLQILTAIENCRKSNKVDFL